MIKSKIALNGGISMKAIKFIVVVALYAAHAIGQTVYTPTAQTIIQRLQTLQNRFNLANYTPQELGNGNFSEGRFQETKIKPTITYILNTLDDAIINFAEFDLLIQNANDIDLTSVDYAQNLKKAQLDLNAFNQRLKNINDSITQFTQKEPRLSSLFNTKLSLQDIQSMVQDSKTANDIFTQPAIQKTIQDYDDYTNSVDNTQDLNDNLNALKEDFKNRSIIERFIEHIKDIFGQSNTLQTIRDAEQAAQGALAQRDAALKRLGGTEQPVDNPYSGLDTTVVSDKGSTITAQPASPTEPVETATNPDEPVDEEPVDDEPTGGFDDGY